MEFASNVEMQKVSREAEELFKNVLTDEDPLFVSDEATIWDVSSAPTADELLARLSAYYGTSLSLNDLKLPLWKLLRKLREERKVFLP
jgi:hypothetical protein